MPNGRGCPWTREAASKEAEDNVASSDEGTGAEQERSTVATNPRERRPQTLISRCLQLPNNPPSKANPRNHEHGPTYQPVAYHHRRYEVVTPTDDAVARETNSKITAFKSNHRDRIHPFNRESL
ncbi:hypothetical protein F2Q70_00009196 [Brassica cretica]|uniref:Uncharacterized protein n=1 Tax=Brassica cretica TaxID=69181 RepID=A0A8S9LZR9_BRACR|nr:hypothetical protein F2Q70_00009196 [Brassica cretica]